MTIPLIALTPRRGGPKVHVNIDKAIFIRDGGEYRVIHFNGNSVEVRETFEEIAELAYPAPRSHG